MVDIKTFDGPTTVVRLTFPGDNCAIVRDSDGLKTMVLAYLSLPAAEALARDLPAEVEMAMRRERGEIE